MSFLFEESKHVRAEQVDVRPEAETVNQSVAAGCDQLGHVELGQRLAQFRKRVNNLGSEHFAGVLKVDHRAFPVLGDDRLGRGAKRRM
ncbi:MAG: hypothetical protein KF861_10045 [Planctomycetaceae bacterium]|nr:hypothetical protein [Planctomycetaceae bacterium]